MLLEVSGRGELHLSILIENMRREGYEFQVSKPEVLYKDIDGRRYEPMEMVTVDVLKNLLVQLSKTRKQKGKMISMTSLKEFIVVWYFQFLQKELNRLSIKF